ncbi:MAG: DUF58 domain-containing protein [Defluviitaleaceae bacterium]|nr:DUF58 domain-containing protein [Defluviitaleaceae bacterium]
MATIGIFIALIIVLLFIRRAYGSSCLKNVDVDLSLSADLATEGDELFLTEVISNRKWLPLPWLAVKFQVDRELEFFDNSAAVVSDLYYRHDLFHILMHQKITRRLKFSCTRRGFYAIRGLEVTGWDILMENKYIRKFDCDAHLTVFPQTLDIRETDALCNRIYGQLSAVHPIYPDPFSFRGIREYSACDPMKSINFKASAKVQQLMVNILDFSNSRQIVLLLDAERHTLWHNEFLEERAIKIVASLAERMNSQGVPTALVTNGAASEIPEGKGSVHMRRILETLAYIDFAEENPKPFTEILERLTPENNPEFWLISPYYTKGVDAALTRLSETGARTAWIMPGDKPKDLSLSDSIIFI